MQTWRADGMPRECLSTTYYLLVFAALGFEPRASVLPFIVSGVDRE
jgi:hypothetical protein